MKKSTAKTEWCLWWIVYVLVVFSLQTRHTSALNSEGIFKMDINLRWKFFKRKVESYCSFKLSTFKNICIKHISSPAFQGSYLENGMYSW